MRELVFEIGIRDMSGVVVGLMRKYREEDHEFFETRKIGNPQWSRDKWSGWRNALGDFEQTHGVHVLRISGELSW